MTMTLPALTDKPLTEGEQQLIAKLIHDSQVSNREAARLQDQDLATVRSTLFEVTRRQVLARKPVEQPLQTIKMPFVKAVKALSSVLLGKAVQLNHKLNELFENGLPDALAERVFQNLINYDEASVDAEKLERWIVKAEKLLADIERNPLLRRSSGDVNFEALDAKKGPELDHSARSRALSVSSNTRRGEAVPHAGRTSTELSARGKSPARGGKSGKKKK